MTSYTIRAGDCLSQIAAERGFDWRTIWNHGDNAELKQLRKDPNVLLPGDVVVIPDKAVREEPRPTDQRHRFVLKGQRTYLRLRLLRHGRPRPGLRYVLHLDGQLLSGATDGDGRIVREIPATARQAELTLGDGEESYVLLLGDLDPLDTTPGTCKRLQNLGYGCGAGERPDETRMKPAVRGFQRRFHPPLAVDGIAGPKTRSKLEEVHGH